jgi:predicted phage tail protein
MRRVILHGRLRKRFGPEFRLDAATVGACIRGIGVQVKGFLEELKKGSYEVIRGNRRSGMRLGEDDINGFQLGQADLHLVPVVKGSRNGNKSGGALKIILGVALVGVAIFASGGTLAAPLAGLSSGGMWGTVAMLGLGLAVSGAAQMMTKKEESKDQTKKEDSFAFSGPTNATAQGNPVALIYGRVMTGSIPASTGIDVEDIPMGDRAAGTVTQINPDGSTTTAVATGPLSDTGKIANDGVTTVQPGGTVTDPTNPFAAYNDWLNSQLGIGT